MVWRFFSRARVKPRYILIQDNFVIARRSWVYMMQLWMPSIKSYFYFGFFLYFDHPWTYFYFFVFLPTVNPFFWFSVDSLSFERSFVFIFYCILIFRETFCSYNLFWISNIGFSWGNKARLKNWRKKCITRSYSLNPYFLFFFLYYNVEYKMKITWNEFLTYWKNDDNVQRTKQFHGILVRISAHSLFFS